MFTPHGRIPRLPYFLNGLPFSIAYVFLTMIGPTYLFVPTRFYYLGQLVVLPGIFFLMYCLYSKRLHDMGIPGWLGGVLLSPAVVSALWMFAYAFIPSPRYDFLYDVWSQVQPILANAVRLAALALLFVPGTRGMNAYGPAPREPVSPANMF